MKPESNFGLVLLVLNVLPSTEDSATPNSPEGRQRMIAELQESLIDHWDENVIHKTIIPVLLVSFPGFESIVTSVLDSAIAKRYPQGSIEILHIPSLHNNANLQPDLLLPLLDIYQGIKKWIEAHSFQLVMVKPFSNYAAKLERPILEHFSAEKPSVHTGITSSTVKEDLRPLIVEGVPFDGLNGPILGLYETKSESRPALMPSADWRAQNYKPQTADTRATGTLYFNLPLTSFCLQGTSRDGLNALEELSTQLLLMFAGGSWQDQPTIFEAALRDLAMVLRIRLLNCEPERGKRGYRTTSFMI
jgi:hypothetical protein